MSKISFLLLSLASTLLLSTLASAAAILNRTPLAATSFTNESGLHIRVYYQSTTGQVKQTDWDESLGWSSPSSDVVGQAKLNTGLAALNWANGTQIRQYYLNQAGALIETSTTNGVTTTTPVKPVAGGAALPVPAPYTKIAAGTYVNAGVRWVKVFFQDATNQIRIVHWNANDGWVEGSQQLVVAEAGTGLSYTILNDNLGNYVKERVFFQGTGARERIYEQSSGAPWAIGTFNSNGAPLYAPGAAMSSAVWGNSVTKEAFRMISVDQDNTLTVAASSLTNTWGPITSLSQSTITGSDTATVALADDSQFRVYYQHTGGQIAEFATNDGTNWGQGADPLPVSST